MSNQNWKELIKRHCPADKRVCNCGDAYYTCIPYGALITGDGDKPRLTHDWMCEAGCTTAQINAREHVAACVLAAEQG